MIPELGLYVSPVSVSIPCVPVAPSTNVRYVVSSVELFATAVTLVDSVAVSALPVTSPVTLPTRFPVTCVVVKTPELGLYVSPVSDSNHCAPVAPSTNSG